ncbi:MAG TPA: TolC family protein, partial [Vicinamibacterales bacterium]|nr:TolC family protein [Vicinamibacterales bacterium]
MRLNKQISAWPRHAAMAALALLVFTSGRQVSASEQVAPAAAQQTAPASAAPQGPVIKVTADDAVRMALEKNLNISAARLDPLIQDLGVAQAQGVWAPSLFATFDRRSSASPPSSFLAGASDIITDSRLATSGGVQQQLRWGGGNYSVSLDGSRSETTGFTSFNPTLRSNFSAQYDQPLLRNFRIDGFRQQYLISQNQRQIADIQLAQTISNTSRAVRYAYYNLIGALGGLEVAQQSLNLARESLKNNRTRVEVGTMAPIDIIEAEAEVASNEEAVILAENNIRSAEDALRVLILDPAQSDYWTARLEPSEQLSVAPVEINIEAAVSNALQNRTDLQNVKKQLEATDINIKYFENQRLPDVNLRATYGLVGLGGTQLGFFDDNTFPPRIDPSRSTQRSFGDVLRDVFGNDYRAWSVGFQVGYPIGRSTAEAGLARSRLARTQGQTSLRALELQV